MHALFQGFRWSQSVDAWLSIVSIVPADRIVGPCYPNIRPVDTTDDIWEVIFMMRCCSAHPVLCWPAHALLAQHQDGRENLADLSLQPTL